MDEPHPIVVRTLGTGGPRIDPQRAGPATLVSIGDEHLLFDAGERTRGQHRRQQTRRSQTRLTCSSVGAQVMQHTA